MVIREGRGDLSGATLAASLKEGGSEPKASDTPGAPTSEIVEFLKGKVPV